ncbi:MAG: Rrf2 family transcriptional regulator [Acidobacteria bacterium]|nr:Rrf2 family transcriptional regulator [Acidobacteriota bacterium]
MLRLSKKTDYALIALKDLASSPAGASSSAREIAARYKIPVELMAKVLQRLAKHGLLASHHGQRGGYDLARPAAMISVADVIQAVDGPVMVTACSDIDESCDQYSTCNVRDPLWRLKDRLVRTLAEFTIDELARADQEERLPLEVIRRPLAPAQLAATSDR